MHQIALVGCAHIHTPGFIKRINERQDIHVKYVWDHNAERAALRAGELNSQVVSDLSTIWNDGDIEHRHLLGNEPSRGAGAARRRREKEYVCRKAARHWRGRWL